MLLDLIDAEARRLKHIQSLTHSESVEMISPANWLANQSAGLPAGLFFDAEVKLIDMSNYFQISLMYDQVTLLNYGAPNSN